MEGIWLQDALATLVTVQADLFRTEEMAGDVEVSGSLTRGMTIFDRRVRRVWRANMDVVVGADLLELRESLVRGLKFAGQETRDSAD
jgi:purine nucleosidase